MVDDHTLFRRGLTALLQAGASREVDVVSTDMPWVTRMGPAGLALELNPDDYADVYATFYDQFKPPFEPLQHTKFYDFRRLYYTAFSRAQNLLALACPLQTGRSRQTGLRRPKGQTRRTAWGRTGRWRQMDQRHPTAWGPKGLMHRTGR